MSVILKKTLRDIMLKFRSTFLAVFALTIGIWGVGTLFTALYILDNDLNTNYQQTTPIHAMIGSADFNKLELNILRDQPEIFAAEYRDRSILRVEVKPNEWLPLWLYSVDDFKQLSLAKFFEQTGDFPPAKGSIAIERNNLLVSDFALGSVARVQSRGKLIKTAITSIIFDPAQAPSTQDAFIYGYTDAENYTRLSGKPAHQRLIIRFNNVDNKQDVKTMLSKLTQQLSDQGIEITSSYIPKFDEHPHQFQLNTILMVNGIIGFLGFIMSMVLISQLMNSIFTQQIRQIGIMKAIGAKGGHIFRIYLTYLLIISSIAIAIGLPLAIITGKAYSAFIAGILNFDILTTSLPILIILAVIALGIILPILFSIPMLRNAVKISVNDALGNHGLSNDNVGAKASKKTSNANIGIFSLSLRNLNRRKSRMLVTLATMALGVAIFSTGFNIRESLSQFLENTATSMKYDLKVVLKNNQDITTAIAPFKGISEITSIEGWLGGVGRIQGVNISTSNGIGLVAMPHDSVLKDHDLTKGTWLTSATEFEFVVNQSAALEFGDATVGQGYPLRINNKNVTAKLVGVVREFDKSKIYIDITKYRSISNISDQINSLMMVLNDRSYDNVIQVKKLVEQIVQQNGIEVLYVESQAERAKIIFDHLNIILVALLILSLLVLSVSSMGMGSAMGINVMERTREIGVLRAIGATPKMVIALFVTEGFMVSLLSVGVGIILSLPISAYGAKFFGNLILGENTPLDFAFSPMGFVITLIVTIGFGYLASRIPAGKATRITVKEAIAYE